MGAVFLSLRHILPFLRGHHVLVRTDNCRGVHQPSGGPALPSVVHAGAQSDPLEQWPSSLFPYVLGNLNAGADMLFRSMPLYGEWTLHQAVVEQVWACYGRASVDKFDSRENAQSMRFSSLQSSDEPLGRDVLAHALALICPTLTIVREHAHSLILIALNWPAMHWLVSAAGEG